MTSSLGMLARRSASSEEVCIELEDYGVKRSSAVDFFGTRNSRDPNAQAGKLAEQFVQRNEALLTVLDTRVNCEYDGRDVRLVVRTGGVAGAIPLISPTSSRPDYGLVVRPRFSWLGIGPLFAEMGWRVSPIPLKLPMLRRSERRVPLWVLSSMILTRLEALLKTLDRRFEFATDDLTAPRGRVDWPTYARNRLPHARVLDVPCMYPDLRDDRRLQGAIRYSVEKQLLSLETQRHHGAFVHQLIEFGNRVLDRVRQFASVTPTPGLLSSWLQRPMRNEHFVHGIQSISWTVEERGLAGLSDLEGIPWRLPMDQFFEAWVETVLTNVCKETGGRLKTGRNRETVFGIDWRPAYQRSQSALIPDFWIEYGNLQVIVDAKYKRHWEELQLHSWSRLEDQLREDHRNDLMQILAYGSLAEASNVVVCLAYPCGQATWESLKERGRLLHRAEIVVGARKVRLWLTAIPMSQRSTEAGSELTVELWKVLQENG
jgi:hypothetical protein